MVLRRVLNRERVAYLIGGAFNTAVGYGVFAVMWTVFGDVWPSWAIILVSNAVATINAFVVQRRFVFRSEGHVVREFARFSLVYLVIALVNAVAFPAMVNGLGLDPYLSQAMFVVFVVVGGYLANKYFTFR